MRTENTQIAISTLCETTFNTPKTLGIEFEGLPTTEPFFLLPKMEKVNDAGRVGRNAPTHLCNTYWSHGEVSIKDDVDTGVPAKLLRRALGGAVTSTLVQIGSGVYDHTFSILPPQVGDVLPSFNILAVLGLSDFVLAGVMTDTIKFSQKNAERVQYEANLVGSGKFVNPTGIATFPAMAATPCMDGFKVDIKYTDVDGSTAVNLASLGKVSEWMVEHKNNIRRDKRRAGDPVLAASGGGSGAYVRKQPRGKYETSAQITVDFNDLTDWNKSVKNEQLTNLTFTIPGQKIGSTVYNHEFELIIPLFGFDTPDTGDDDGDATTPINIVCLEDPVTKGTMKVRIRNASSTMI
jgi:hypothetical protein